MGLAWDAMGQGRGGRWDSVGSRGRFRGTLPGIARSPSLTASTKEGLVNPLLPAAHFPQGLDNRAGGP